MTEILNYPTPHITAPGGAIYPLQYDETTIADAADQINQAWEDIGEIKHEQLAYCRFCGQVQDVSGIEYQYSIDYNEYATRRCNCPEAKHYFDQISAQEKAKCDRDYALQDASEVIEEMFGEGAKENGKHPAKQEVKDLILQTATLIYDRKLKDTTIKINNQTKVKISKTPKDKVQFERKDEVSYKREVDE